ncbi:hypothetical protein J4573_34015 [Actinomadura barringtoniae]|uniref:Gram-positive cocci surface proteins LPxTG domain-containing protein n=1 Tax=Actinomadura barringtoniae TaxID=1427535 RepID=A0A939PH33_9ACTN|nr:hypothetical protein [Actinomadura barringtoniae]MBO2452147.1 hypothetical protein [Actinomadura barringtoniae]
MPRASLMVVMLGAGLAATCGTCGTAFADGPTLPANARGTTLTISPARVRPGAPLALRVRCMTHVGGTTSIRVVSPSFPTLTGGGQQRAFKPQVDPAAKPGTYTVRAVCRTKGAYVAKSPAADLATFVVEAPPAPPAPKRRSGPPLAKAGPAQRAGMAQTRAGLASKAAGRHAAKPGKATQTSKVPVGAAATGGGPVDDHSGLLLGGLALTLAGLGTGAGLGIARRRA